MNIQERHIDPGDALPTFTEDRAAAVFTRMSEVQKHVQAKFRALPLRNKSGKHIYVEMVASVNVQVEKMIRKAALAGQGFGLDELDENGLLSRKFLRNAITVGAFRKSDNQLVGGLLVGQSSLVRTIGSFTFGGYAVIDEAYRRRGYAHDMITICEEIARDFGVRNILSDILISPSGMPGFHLAISAGYTTTGQLPKCAYLKDVGLTDSLLIYKRLRFPVGKL